MMAMDKHDELPKAVRRVIESQDISDNLQGWVSELVKAKPVLPCLRGRTIHVISEGPEACSVNNTAIQENAHDVWGNSERVESECPETNKITFTAEEGEGVLVSHRDALVISLIVANCLVKRILVDSGSSSNIIFQTAYQGLGLEEKVLIRKTIPFVGFSGEDLEIKPCSSLGWIKHKLSQGNGNVSKPARDKFECADRNTDKPSSVTTQ
ncbi:hypothetical protein F2Q68_00010251 [Brassica cretica]|uniref:Uncharacterized protein n=1 Tax=Brassica cretica TaxID=69181 RepID=A0A3N6QFH9_BRACR|nr:hypothetical protein F2Q68_00010251 [Brassica cretica]